MRTDYVSVGLLAVGLGWFVNPVYWPLLEAAGLAGVADWLGALGLVPGGSYYVGLGAAYVVAGLAGFRYAREGLGVRGALAVAAAGVVPTVVGVVGSYSMRVGTAGATSLTLALGVTPTLLAVAVGAAERRRIRVALGAVGVALLAPWAGWVVFNAGFPPAGRAGLYAYSSVALLACLNAVWGVPLVWLGDRLGRTARYHRQPAAS